MASKITLVSFHKIFKILYKYSVQNFNFPLLYEIYWNEQGWATKDGDFSDNRMNIACGRCFDRENSINHCCDIFIISCITVFLELQVLLIQCAN